MNDLSINLKQILYPNLINSAFLVIDDKKTKIESIRNHLRKALVNFSYTEKRARIRSIEVNNINYFLIIEEILYNISDIIYFSPGRRLYLLFDHYIYLNQDQDKKPTGKCIYGGVLISEIFEIVNGELKIKREHFNRIKKIIKSKRDIEEDDITQPKISIAMTTADPSDCVNWLNIQNDVNTRAKQMLLRESISGAFGEFDILNVVEIDNDSKQTKEFLQELEQSTTRLSYFR